MLAFSGGVCSMVMRYTKHLNSEPLKEDKNISGEEKFAIEKVCTKVKRGERKIARLSYFLSRVFF